MNPPDSGILQSEAGIAFDGAIPFLFELSWRTLTQVEPAAAVAPEPPPPDRSGPSDLDVLFEVLQELLREGTLAKP